MLRSGPLWRALNRSNCSPVRRSLSLRLLMNGHLSWRSSSVGDNTPSPPQCGFKKLTGANRRRIDAILRSAAELTRSERACRVVAHNGHYHPFLWWCKGSV